MTLKKEIIGIEPFVLGDRHGFWDFIKKVGYLILTTDSIALVEYNSSGKLEEKK